VALFLVAQERPIKTAQRLLQLRLSKLGKLALGDEFSSYRIMLLDMIMLALSCKG